MLRSQLLLLLACTSLLSAKTHVAERYDVRVRILPDTTLEVNESVRFRFEGGPFSFVSREVRKAGTDRIFGVQADMDGEPARADIDDTGNVVRIVWHFDAPADTTHEFTLRYRVEGAVRKESGFDLLDWNAIPGRHDYRIEAGAIEVEYPESAGVIGRPEATRAVSSRHDRTRSTFTLEPLGPERGAAVHVRFESGFAREAPAWQTASLLRRKRIAGAWTTGIVAALLAAVCGIVWLLSERRSIAPNAALHAASVVPSDLGMPPAVAARLAGGAGGIHAHLGTLFDLARRGALSIREGEGHRFSRRKYTIEPGDLSVAALPFERVLLTLVFGEGPELKPREFSSFVTRISTAGGKVSGLVEQHMTSLRLLDADRIRLQRRWAVGGLLVLFAGLLGAAAGAALAARDASPILAALAGIGAGLFVVGVGAIIVSAGLSPLTANGARQAAPCRALKRHLAAIARGAAPASPGDFERWLPFALALGAGTAWVKRFREEAGTAMPPWFDVNLSGGDGLAFFDFVASSSASADASSSGGGDGGGSGGGSSSAG
jgi:hypothetical protein